MPRASGQPATDWEKMVLGAWLLRREGASSKPELEDDRRADRIHKRWPHIVGPGRRYLVGVLQGALPLEN